MHQKLLYISICCGRIFGTLESWLSLLKCKNISIYYGVYCITSKVERCTKTMVIINSKRFSHRTKFSIRAKKVSGVSEYMTLYFHNIS